MIKTKKTTIKSKNEISHEKAQIKYTHLKNN